MPQNASTVARSRLAKLYRNEVSKLALDIRLNNYNISASTARGRAVSIISKKYPDQYQRFIAQAVRDGYQTSPREYLIRFRIRYAAKTALARRFSTEFQEFYNEEKQEDPDKINETIRRRALSRLARLYKEEYEEELQKAKKRLGVD